jgi:predicted nucleic acid-binding protein
VTVVDASVAVKWLTVEKGTETANRLLTNDNEFCGPLLLRVEVAAAVARKARQREITLEDAWEALDVWNEILASHFDMISEVQDFPAALKLSLKLNHPLQDCLYLALAERVDATLVTADERFVAKTRESHPRVRLLATTAKGG